MKTYTHMMFLMVVFSLFTGGAMADEDADAQSSDREQRRVETVESRAVNMGTPQCDQEAFDLGFQNGCPDGGNANVAFKVLCPTCHPTDEVTVEVEDDSGNVLAHGTGHPDGVVVRLANVPKGEYTLFLTGPDGERLEVRSYIFKGRESLMPIASVSLVTDDPDAVVCHHAGDCDNDTFESDEDCDDWDAAVNPDAQEVLNGVDDDCNGIVDNNTEVYDDDGDGYSESQGDCDDSQASIHPGATEHTNGKDDDCDGDVDEDTRWSDDDGDGFSEIEGDTDDGNADVFPGSDAPTEEEVRAENGDCLPSIEMCLELSGATSSDVRLEEELVELPAFYALEVALFPQLRLNVGTRTWRIVPETGHARIHIDSTGVNFGGLTAELVREDAVTGATDGADTEDASSDSGSTETETREDPDVITVEDGTEVGGSGSSSEDPKSDEFGMTEPTTHEDPDESEEATDGPRVIVHPQDRDEVNAELRAAERYQIGGIPISTFITKPLCTVHLQFPLYVSDYTPAQNEEVQACLDMGLEACGGNPACMYVDGFATADTNKIVSGRNEDNTRQAALATARTNGATTMALGMGIPMDNIDWDVMFDRPDGERWLVMEVRDRPKEQPFIPEGMIAGSTPEFDPEQIRPWLDAWWKNRWRDWEPPAPSEKTVEFRPHKVRFHLHTLAYLGTYGDFFGGGGSFWIPWRADMSDPQSVVHYLRVFGELGVTEATNIKSVDAEGNPLDNAPLNGRQWGPPVLSMGMGVDLAFATKFHRFRTGPGFGMHGLRFNYGGYPELWDFMLRYSWWFNLRRPAKGDDRMFRPVFLSVTLQGGFITGAITDEKGREWIAWYGKDEDGDGSPYDVFNEPDTRWYWPGAGFSLSFHW